MTRLISILLAAEALLLAQSPPQFGSRVELVVLSAIVTDENGRFVPSLDKGLFEVVEDGVPVPISTFASIEAAPPLPRDEGRFLVLLLDDLVTKPVLTVRMKAIAHAFVDRMGPGDVLTVARLNGGSSASSSRATDLRAAINRLTPFGGSLLSGFEGRRHAMEAIEAVADQLAGVRHRRKVLVCLGPAHLFNQQFGEHHGEGDPHIRRAIAATARASLTTYVIDPVGLAAAGTVTAAVGEGLDGFARETGGSVFSNVNDFRPAIDQVWRESGDYYLIGYESRLGDGRRHSVDVRLRSRGLQVRARRSR